MKKLLPLLLVCVLLVVALAATGCKSDELQAQIDTNNANAQTAIQEAAQKAADDLAAAKSALEALVAAGDKANADDLTAALAELNAAIDAAEAAAANADTGIKTYLKAAVDAAKAEAADAVAELKTELTEKIDAAVAALEDAAATDAEALTNAVAELTNAIDAVETAAAAADATLKAELEAAIADAVAALKTELTEKIDAAVAALEAADAANTQALTDAVATLNNAVEAAKAAATAADATLKTELEGAIATAVGTLKTELTEKINDVVADLEDLDGTKIDAEEYYVAIGEIWDTLGSLAEAHETLSDAVNKLDATYATDADVDAKIEAAVEAAVTALTEKIDAAVAELKAADATKVNAIEYNEKIEELEGLIQTLTGVNADLDETYATDVDVDAKIAEAIAALKDAYIAIGAWNDATEVVDAALKEIKDLFDAYSTPLYADRADEISAAYDLAWVMIVRAVDTDAVNTAVETYKTTLEELPTPGALVYKALKAIAADVDGVKCTADVRKALVDLRASIDELKARDPALDDEVQYEIEHYVPEGGTEEINLDEKCTEYQEKYNTLKAAGEAIKADMDTVVAAPLSLTLKAGNVDIDAAYDEWIGAGNEATEIDGFVDSKTAYDAKKATIAEYETKGNDLKAEIDAWLVANPVVGLEHETAIDELIAKHTAWMTATNNDSEALIDGLADSKANIDVADARVETLKEAKTVAANINNQINAIVLVNTGDATKTVKTTLDGITSQINAWVGTYGLGTDAELAYGENYNLVHHDQLEALYEKFDELVGEFMAAFEDFMNAYNAIGEDITLLSRDEIAAAREAYDAWRAEAALGTFDYELTGGVKPADYTVAMLQKEAEYNNYVEDALVAYEARFDAGLTVNTVTIYNVAEVELIESWYAEFGVVDGVEYVFEDGYYLSEDITVTAEDYAKVVALRDAFDELVAAKIAETETLQGLIDDLADDVITTDSRAKINEALAAREAWLAGDNAPAGYTADQFKIIVDPTYVIDDAALDTANSDCEALENEAAALKQLIADLPAYTVSTDIVDDAARLAYEGLINDIRTAQEAFELHNDGNRGCVTETEFAKVEAGELALVKYDAVVEITAEYTAAVAQIDPADETNLGALETAYNDHIGYIDASDTDAKVANNTSAAKELFTAIVDAANA